MAPPLKPPLVAVKNGFDSLGNVVVVDTISFGTTAIVLVASLGLVTLDSCTEETIGAAFIAWALQVQIFY